MKSLLIFACLAALPVLAAPQQFQLNLDSVAAKASEHVEVSLNAATLQFAARFLDANNPDEAKVKKLLAGIEGIYVRHFTFKSTGAWSEADLEPVRAQLRGPEWSKIVGVVSSEEGENAEIWLRTSGNKSIGVAIVATEPKEITVVNIAGTIDLEALAELGGHFGVPKVKAPEKQHKEE
ncbi:MAG: DUF4252 domain-containing protein [Bryobacteraceae bacterium]